MDAIETLALPEDDFRLAVSDLESAPLFRKLLDVGAIRRRALRGRIPAEEYRAYLDSDVLPLIRRCGVAEAPGWLEEFARAWPSGVAALARKHRMPEADASRISRYASRVLADSDDAEPHGPVSVALADSARATPAPPERTQALIAGFVERYGLSEKQLRELILDDSAPVDEAARQLGAPSEALARVREAAAILLFADAPAPSRGSSAAQGRPEAVVGRVVVEDGVPRLSLAGEDVYSVVYALSPAFLDVLDRFAASPEEADALLRRIRQVNDRKSLIARVLAALVSAQSAYLAGGGEAALRPLSQAEIARRVGEHPSTICRLVRDRLLDTPNGPIRLKDLFASRTAVIARLAAEFPEASDQRLAEVLRDRHGVSLGRRAIGYHRAKSAH